MQQQVHMQQNLAHTDWHELTAQILLNDAVTNAAAGAQAAETHTDLHEPKVWNLLHHDVDKAAAGAQAATNMQTCM